ncbi:unnamed protein product [Paramecium octaurelia]|uniref:Uncharacterized protein n=1 Tax=Paramecium octaurelia TaxID=43137 RepID=A0A8S1V0B6_PAROT|nr:unnamed protein product [Paramecium octaurelia]
MQKQIKIKERKVIITKQTVNKCLINELGTQIILNSDSKVLYYSISCGKLLRNLFIEQSIIPDNYYLKNLVVSKKFDSSSLRIYDLTTALLLKNIMKKDLQVLCFTINSQQTLLALSDLQGKISILNIRSGLIATYRQKLGCPHYLKFNHSETILYSYSKQSAQGFDVLKKQLVWQIELNSQRPEIFINSSCKHCLFTLNFIDSTKQSSSFQLENLETGYVQGYFCNLDFIKEFCISNNGICNKQLREKYILIVSDKTIEVYDRVLSNLILQLQFQDIIFRATLCHNSELILVTKEDSKIQFYNLIGECIRTIEGISNFWVDIDQKKFITYIQGQCRVQF